MSAGTKAGGTLTSERFIAHKRHPGGFDAPVALDIHGGYKRKIEGMNVFAPQTRAGKLVYALPGGGRWVP